MANVSSAIGNPANGRGADPPIAKWKAWLMIGVMLFIGGLLLFWGLTIVVRAERITPERVDVTLERRFLGLVPIASEVVTDVTEADVYVVLSGTRGVGLERRGAATAALELTTRSGAVVRRARFGPSVGAAPADIADQIQQVLTDPARPPMSAWWMPWLVNLGAIPLVLIGGATVGEVLLRALGLMQPSAPK